MKFTKQRIKEIIKEELLAEATTRLSTMKDLDIHTGGKQAVLYGKKYKLGLDRKSLLYLVKLIRQEMGLYEGPALKEGKVFKLPNGLKVEFLGKMKLVLSRGSKQVELDVGELKMFLKGAKNAGVREGKLTEGKRKELEIHVMDKLKVDKILKKLKLKPGKDYDIGAGSSRSFMLDIDVKHLDKVISLLMQNRIRTK